MIFPKSYKCLKLSSFKNVKNQIIPIRYKDRLDIMKWRNEQLYHLRQERIITKKNQDYYFSEVISKIFEEENPNQLLFSYLENNKCIGYGGLVHINWKEKNAEISFIMDTSLEGNYFDKHWTIFLNLIKKIAFHELAFNSVFTFAYDLREHLYTVLEKNEFILKRKLKNDILNNKDNVGVTIHECKNPILQISIRESKLTDKELIYNWSNDPLVRNNSFNTNTIIYEDHEKWYNERLNDENSLLLINEIEGIPAGFIRFEIKKKYAVVGILLNKQFRGKGLSSLMLKRSCSYFFKIYNCSILAYIKESNKASIKTFKNSGFILHKKDDINGFTTFVYKLKKT